MAYQRLFSKLFPHRRTIGRRFQVISTIDAAAVEIEPESIEDADPGSQVTDRVRIDIASISWIPEFFNFEATQIVAESSMRSESTN